MLEASPGWTHGPLRVVATTQIGTAYGWSGRLHRVRAETRLDGALTFVVKQASADAVDRELLFRSECRRLPQGCMPSLLGGVSDRETGRGVLVLEDIAPAEQGDVLRVCTPERAEAVVRVLAQVHATSWQTSDNSLPAHLPRWEARPLEPDRWAELLARAAERFPQILTRGRTGRLRDLPEAVAAARERLRVGPAAWCHGDAHLDNVLWRPDGTAVVLDWCNAAIGPPAVDLARFSSEGIDGRMQSTLVAAYVRELRRSGVAAVEPAEVETALELALLPLLQSAVDWAGREVLVLEGRRADVCESWLGSLCSRILAGN